ncbi:MAG: type III-A CRISPR-associated protein Csm2 [Pseudomonadales bacterium]|nr:type III-A CRISPR-associated protein Csm2 [Pseudomonadales bacterium]
MDTSNIKLSEPTAELYDTVAHDLAKRIADSGGGRKNRSTQLRKFYDEIVMWDQRVKTNPDKFNEYLPLIRMINAKVAYAKGRDLVDENFFKLMSSCLKEVKDAKTFENCKRFLEAFMGFYKMYSPK